MVILLGYPLSSACVGRVRLEFRVVVAGEFVNVSLGQVPVPRVAIGIVDNVIKHTGGLYLYRVDLVAVGTEVVDKSGFRGVFLAFDENNSVSILNDCAVLFHFNFLLPVGYLRLKRYYD